MKKWVLLILAVFSLLAGCASGYGSRANETSYEPAVSDYPKSYYDYNPQLENWYIAPYWNPDVGG